MPRIPGLRRYTRNRPSGANVERQVDDELASHFAMCVDELVSHGMTPQEARAEAERRFGDVSTVKRRLTRIDRERIRDERRADWWNALSQDTRYAARGLRRTPVFTIGVVITLALGIGANAAVLTFLDRLLLRPPPHVTDATNLRRINVEMTFQNGNTDTRGPMSFAEFDAIRSGTKAFDRIAAFRYPNTTSFGRGVDAPRVKLSAVSADFFRTLGVQPHLGRFFVADDDDDTVSRPAAVLGYAMWQNRFAGRANVVGESIVLDAREHVIVGVAPKGFSGADVDAPDVWAPLSPTRLAESGVAWKQQKLNFSLHIVAHLAPGVTGERAAAQTTAVIRPAYEETFLAKLPATVRLASIVPGRRIDHTDSNLSVATRVLGAAAMVLLIACANVANLLLARALARRRELAVRLALGVGRARLVRQLLTESVLLAVIAGAAAVTVAVWGGSLLRGLLMPDLTWVADVVDGPVLAFTIGVAVVVGLVAGLAPAVQMTRHDLADALKSGTRGSGGGKSRVRAALLITQAAFTMILLVGTGLFVRSLVNAQRLDVGFALDRTILGEMKFSKGSVKNAERGAVYDALSTRVKSVPGVASSATANTAPYWITSYQRLVIPGRDSLPPDLRAPPVHPVGEGYLQTMGMPVVTGRGLTPDDGPTSELVTVVNDALARRAWPGESPLGKCIKIGSDTMPCRTVVGVVANVGLSNFREPPTPQYYIPVVQAGPVDEFNRVIVARAADGADVREVATAIRNVLKGARPDIEYVDVRPFTDLVEPELRPFRVGASLFGALGILALGLAGIGLYAVISFGVARRTREIGIRAALGARASDLVGLVLGEGVCVTLVGVALGVLLALSLSRVVESLLFGTSAHDPVVYAIAIVTLMFVAVLASVIPGWRAASVDPVIALHSE